MRYILTLSNLLLFVGYENIQLWTFLVWLHPQRMERNLYSFSAEHSQLLIINFKLLVWVYMHRWIHWSNHCSAMSGCPISKVSEYFDILHFLISQFLLFHISLFYITLPPTSTLRVGVYNCRSVTLSSAPERLLGPEQSKFDFQKFIHDRCLQFLFKYFQIFLIHIFSTVFNVILMGGNQSNWPKVYLWQMSPISLPS